MINLPLQLPTDYLHSVFIYYDNWHGDWSEGFACHAAIIDFYDYDLVDGKLQLNQSNTPSGWDGKWPLTGTNRFRFWIAFTPSIEGHNYIQLRVSNDAPPNNFPLNNNQNFIYAPVTPTAYPWLNTIPDSPTGDSDDNDPHLVFNPDYDGGRGCIYCYYNNEMLGGGPNQRFRLNSDLVIDDNSLIPTVGAGAMTIGPPSVIREDATNWYNFGIVIDGDDNCFGLQKSIDGLVWDEVIPFGSQTELSAKYACGRPVHSFFMTNKFMPGRIDVIFSVGLEPDGSAFNPTTGYFNTAEVHGYVTFDGDGLPEMHYMLPTFIIAHPPGDEGTYNNPYRWCADGFYRSAFTLSKSPTDEIIANIWVDGLADGMRDLIGFTSGPIYALPRERTFVLPSVQITPSVSPVSLVGVSLGSFALPAASLTPAVIVLTFQAAQSKVFTLPIVQVQVAVTAMRLLGGSAIRAPNGSFYYFRDIYGNILNIKTYIQGSWI